MRRWRGSKPAHLAPPDASTPEKETRFGPSRLAQSGAILSGVVYRNQNSPGRSSNRPTSAQFGPVKLPLALTDSQFLHYSAWLLSLMPTANRSRVSAGFPP